MRFLRFWIHDRPPALAAHRAFAHPLWVASLLLLLVNDHLLKGAQLLPGWMTGKLSDFAGLFMAPATVAALCWVRTRRGFLWAHAGLGLFFAAIKLWPAAARAFEALTALGPLPGRIVVDPTDLIALPALWASYRLLLPLAEGSRALPASLRGSALLLSAFGCVATSAQPNPSPPLPQNFPPVQASLVIANETGEPRVVRVRRLKESVQIDCDSLVASPGSMLDRALFAPAETWLVDTDRAMPLTSGEGSMSKACEALLIDGDSLDDAIVFWMRNLFPPRSLPSTRSGADTRASIFLRKQGSKLVLSEHEAVFPGPTTLGVQPSETCRVPPLTEGVEWSEPVPVGMRQLTAVTTSPDGCAALDFDKTRFYLCGLHQELPFKAGETLSLSTLTAGERGRALAGVAIKSMTGGEVRVGRGLDVVPLGLAEVVTKVLPVEGCPGLRVECGGVARPLAIHIPGEDPLGAGDTLSFDDGKATLQILRAQEMPVVDTSCSPPTAAFSSTTLPTVIESSLVLAGTP